MKNALCGFRGSFPKSEKMTLMVSSGLSHLGLREFLIENQQEMQFMVSASTLKLQGHSCCTDYDYSFSICFSQVL